MSPVLVIAHAGHVLVDLAVYLGPVLLVLGVLKLSDLRRRRAGDEGESGSAEPGETI